MGKDEKLEKFLDGVVKFIHVGWYALVGAAAVMTLFHYVLEHMH